MVSLDMDDEEESNTSSATTDNILSGLNGGTTGGRSVSNTLHDRSRLTSTSAPPVNGGSSTTVGRHQQSHNPRSTRNSTSSTSSHHHHHSSSRRNEGDRISSASSSTSTAKESFLNYFFGQNGPGPVAGANITSMSSEVHGHLNRVGGTVGRDVSGPDTITNAFMRPRNGPVGDGSDAAFDMKSLGKHIEAVSPNFSPFPFGVSVGGGFWGKRSVGPVIPLWSCRWHVMGLGGRVQGPLQLLWIRNPLAHLYGQISRNCTPSSDYSGMLILFTLYPFYLTSCGKLVRTVANIASYLPSPSDFIRRRLAAEPQGRDGDQLDSIAHHVVFRHRQADDSRLDTEGDHAFAGEPYFETRSR